MNEVSIVGARNSGKTTLLTQLVSLLTTEGCRVASVKHTGHQHRFDIAGKDSWHHRKAGAGLTLAVSTEEAALYGPSDPCLLTAIRALMEQHFEWCLVEGDKSSDRQKVLLTDNIDSLREALPSNVIATYGTQPGTGDVPHFERDEVAELFLFLKERFRQHTPSVVQSHEAE